MARQYPKQPVKAFSLPGAQVSWAVGLQVGMCHGRVLTHCRSLVGTALSLKLSVKSGWPLRRQVEQVFAHAGTTHLPGKSVIGSMK